MGEQPPLFVGEIPPYTPFICWLMHLLDPFEADVVAFLHDYGITRISVETDVVLVKQAVSSGAWRLSAVGKNVTREIKNLQSWNLHLFQITNVPRSCNRVAHNLATQGCVCREEEDPRVDPLPVCIQEFVAADCVASEEWNLFALKKDSAQELLEEIHEDGATPDQDVLL